MKTDKKLAHIDQRREREREREGEREREILFSYEMIILNGEATQVQRRLEI